MSADHDGDRHMLSSPEESDTDVQTPAAQISNIANPSPPDSQHRTSAAMPTSNAGASIANSNGKRPLNTISSGQDDQDEIETMGNGKARQEHPTKTHANSGYTWNRPEDEPGYAWLSKKAIDEYNRAYDGLLHKDRAVRDNYGDPFEMAQKEKAIADSMKAQ